MTLELHVLRAGPGVTVQDLGRLGYLGFGLSRGGAADRLALYEGAALLGQPANSATLEMAGFGGEFEATADLRIALTGAPMRVTIDGDSIAWNASHSLPRGARLSIGAATSGCYGYLHVGGGFETEVHLGSRSAHIAADIGAPLVAGDSLPVGADAMPGNVGFCIEPDPRFDGGLVRMLPGPQTRFFAKTEQARFVAETFRRDSRGNRMGVRLVPSGAPFATDAGLSILSEMVVHGDIQVTGDGTPFVLLAECQTTGGYPRIGTVLQADLPRVSQATAGQTLRFECLTSEAAIAADRTERQRIATLPKRLVRLVRDPAEIQDLLSYQLISGVTAGDDFERNDT